MLLRFIKRIQANLLIRKGGKHFEKKEYPQAILYFEKVSNLYPNWAIALANIGIAWHANNNLEKGIEYYNKALQLDSTYSPALYYKSIAQAKLGQKAGAIVTVQELLRVDPGHYAAHEMYSFLLYETGQHEEAIKINEQALSLTEDKNHIRHMMADNYSKLKQHRKSIELYSDMLRDDPKDTTALNNRGYRQNMLGNYEAAISDFDKAIEIDPDFAFPYNNRGYAYLKLGGLEKAIADINHSLTLDPVNSYAFKNKALYYIETGDLVQAKDSLQKAAALGFKEKYGDEVDELLKKYI